MRKPADSDIQTGESEPQQEAVEQKGRVRGEMSEPVHFLESYVRKAWSAPVKAWKLGQAKIYSKDCTFISLSQSIDPTLQM